MLNLMPREWDKARERPDIILGVLLTTQLKLAPGPVYNLKGIYMFLFSMI